MNPLLYKAHPLLYLTVDALANPSAHGAADFGRLALIYLALNLAWTPGLWWGVKKAAGFAPSWLAAYALALPALLFYLPLMLTLLGDIVAHEFHFADRFIAVLCLLVASQMLGAFYAVAVRYPRNRIALGLQDGMTVALLLWLLSVPMGLALLALNAALKIV